MFDQAIQAVFKKQQGVSNIAPSVSVACQDNGVHGLSQVSWYQENINKKFQEFSIDVLDLSTSKFSCNNGRCKQYSSNRSTSAGSRKIGHQSRRVAAKQEKKKCPRCGRWCKYDTRTNSIIICVSCGKKF
ncbi:hypothetical protein Adt_36925 [Abeliophyllum distichum]|uniref:GATA-type domain-containing protein n=1 Tax=Abeliophyllum distichum TaxID=126358 RepID=A0ABD1QJU4_9LAMI